MIDDAEELNRRIAYLDALRGLHRIERLAGFVLILLGVGLTLGGWVYQPWPAAMITVGWVLVAIGWVLFVYVIWRRTAWRRANPFESWRP
jgi:hypothetical protein